MTRSSNGYLASGCQLRSQRTRRNLDFWLGMRGELLQSDEYATLEADWPASLPTGVQHCIIWMDKIIFDPSHGSIRPDLWQDIAHNGYQGVVVSRADW